MSETPMENAVNLYGFAYRKRQTVSEILFRHRREDYSALERVNVAPMALR